MLNIMGDELRAGRALDEQCAYALEFLPCTCGDPHCVHIPHFTASPIAARLLEDEIERRERHQQYIEALSKLVSHPVSFDADGWDGISGGASASDYWAFIRATPEQRARAFLKVVTPDA